MARGRCPGCSMEDSSAKKVRSHMNECPDVLRLYREDPARVVDPETEFVRWRNWMASDEGVAALQQARDERDEGYKQRFEAQLAREHERWNTPAPVD